MDDYLARIMGYAKQRSAPWGSLGGEQPALDDVPLWLQSAGMGPTQEQEPMTRALPGYESRDPNELAMLRHREMVRPQAGRQDFPIEHLANMAGAAASLTPAGAVLAPEFMIGRTLAAGAQHLPKLTTAALAGGATLTPSMAGGAEQPSDQIKQIQMRLQAKGEYNGPIDGIMKPGGPTEKAFKAEQEAERLRVQQEQDALRLRNQGTANEAAIETARATKAKAEADALETKRQQEAAAALLARKQSGDERIKELDKNLSPTSRIIRDYSGPAGLVAGTLFGSLARYGTAGLSNKFTREGAKAGDAIMAENVAAGKKGADAVLARAARANEFWRKGGGEVPFLLDAGKAPGFAVNPSAAKMKDIYSPNVHPGVEAAAIAPAVIEEEVSRHYKGEWETKLADAEKAVSEDPSEANIQRLNKAKDNVALFTGLQRAGMASGMVQGVGAVGSRFMKKGQDMQPNMMAAEQEQAAVQKWLREYAEKAQKKALKNAPQSEPRALVPPVGVPPAMTGPAATKARTLHNL